LRELVTLLQQGTLVLLFKVTNVRLSLCVLPFPLFALLGDLAVDFGYLPHLLLHFFYFTSEIADLLSKRFDCLLPLSDCLKVVVDDGLLFRNDLLLALMRLAC